MTTAAQNAKKHISISKEENKEEEVKKEDPKLKPSEKFKEKSEENEFFGVPLSKREPQNEAEVRSKLSMPFENANQLFQVIISLKILYLYLIIIVSLF